jgi:cytochrome b6-f complex iron-sulfur subunit
VEKANEDSQRESARPHEGPEPSTAITHKARTSKGVRSRRNLLLASAWALVSSSSSAALVGFIRLLFPRVTSSLPQTVVLGSPDDFSIGEVSEKWQKEHQFVVVRDNEGFYALRSVCSHLGCIPRFSAAQRKFKCPCHGSGFHLSGINFEGPAPRPLERLKIFLDETGSLAVDKSLRFRREKGEWRKQGAFLPYREQQHGRT